MIPAGAEEELYVQFTPTEQYNYHYDSIRIDCESDKIVIPIHAFPVINSLKDELLPSLIDMGKHRKVGQTYTKHIEIESNCPVNFEYKIEIVEPHPDIMVSPLAGDIWGLETTLIEVVYSP